MSLSNSFGLLLRRLIAAGAGAAVSLVAWGQCDITVESGSPFCAGESIDLDVFGSPPGTTFNWTSPGCGNCLSGTTTSGPVLIVPPPSTGTDITINVTVNEPGQPPCAASIVIDLLATPSAALTAPALDPPIDFNGLPVYYDCTDPASLTIDFVDACACAGATTYSIDWGNPDPNSGGSYASWTESHTYTNGLSTISYTVTNGSTGCSDNAEYGVFLGTIAIPGGAIGNPNSEPVCTGEELFFDITGTGSNDPGTQYTVFWGDGTSEVLSSPPPSSISHVYLTGSCGPQSNAVTCGGFTNTNNSTNTFLPLMCIETPCNQSTPSAGAAQVYEAPVASFTVSDPLICVGENIVFTSTSEGQQIGPPSCGPPDLVWSITPSSGWSGTLTGADVQNITFNEPGSYTVQLITTTDVCGDDMVEQVICVESPPTADFSIVLSDPDLCFTTDVIITPILTNTEHCPEPMTFDWGVTGGNNPPCNPSGPAVLDETDPLAPELTFNGPGTYTITMFVTDPGCPAEPAPSQQVTVYGPPILTNVVLSNDTFCTGIPFNVIDIDSVNCGQGMLTYDWSVENGAPPNPAGPDPQINFTGFGTGDVNSVALTISNACGSSATFSSEVTMQVATADIVMDVQDAPICPGDPVTVSFNNTAGVTYNWAVTGTSLSGTTDQSPFDITGTSGLASASYIVTISVPGSGCGGASASDDFTVLTPESLSIDPIPDNCAGSEIAVAVTGATVPQWTINGDPGPQAETFLYELLATTTFVVSSPGVPGASCPGYDELTVTAIEYPEPVITSGLAPCTGSAYTFINGTSGGPFQWSWLVDGAAVANNTDQNLSYTFDPPPGDHVITLWASTLAPTICSAFTDITITTVEGPSVSVTTEDASVCDSTATVNLEAVVSGSDLVYDWQWDPDPTSESTVEDPGNQTFIMVDNAFTQYTATLNIISLGSACDTVSSSVVISLYPDPAAAIGTVTTPCAGVESEIPDLSTGADGHIWYVDGDAQDDTGNLFHTFTTSGPHELAIALTTNTTPVCADSIAIIIDVAEPPTVDLPLTAIDTCSAGLLLDFNPVVGGTGPTFIWDFETPADADDLISAAPTGIFFPGNPLNDTTYHVEVIVTVLNSMCANAVDSMTVTLLPFPISNLNTDFEDYCEGDSVLVTQVDEGIIDSCQWVFSDQPYDTVTTVYPIIQTWHTFPLVDVPTDYYITCLVHNPCGVAVDTDTIRIIPSDITIATHVDTTTGCAPLTVTFENNTPFDLDYYWYFPQLSSIQYDDTVIMEFDTAGVYIAIARSYACGFDEDTILITVLPSPPASFDWSPDPICTNTPVTFTNTANGTAVALWTFGDGDSTTVAQPTHLYNEATTYMVQLTTGWPLNLCTGDTTAGVAINAAPQGSFTFAPPICAPDTICFQATVADATTFDWTFHDLQSAGVEDPCVVYPEPGTFQVTVLISNAAGCELFLDTLVVIDTLPIAAFSGSVLDPCHLPAQAEFENGSEFATGYQWFVDGVPASTATDPTFTLPNSQDYTVSLTALGTIEGPECSATIDTVITVFPPPLAAGEVLTDPACSMQPVLFDASASENGMPFWSLGDGTTSDQLQFMHLYALDSTYFVHLTITGAGGCTDTLEAPIEVVVYPSPVAAFTWLPDDQLSEIIHFRNASTGSVRWEWDFGDGATSEEEHPDHRYNLRVDGCDWTTTLVAFSAEGCIDTIRQAVEAKVSVVYFMANAFTPNGQGPAQNERFAPDFVAPIDVVAQCEYRLSIFDRWGHPLFETTDPLSEWDGHFPAGNPVPQGPYTWAVHLLHPCIPLTFRDREGHVNVLR